MRELVGATARVGNIHVNRNRLAQWSKASLRRRGAERDSVPRRGPHYVARFATERVTCIDPPQRANASLMSAIDG